ncbi:hypothetical protein M7I_4602 [Glarea lozoyensis 74030]|uniref:Uncharacterized protein n=1 Tax=Glarea lozoyensis (strain ATCC 74030 / MF5533) TaxID=1104152 RepID=H0EPL9_GLAL7|nr:hypothetical protein M7I_4602 [Glarea lozoyensis 74030]
MIFVKYQEHNANGKSYMEDTSATKGVELRIRATMKA